MPGNDEPALLRSLSRLFWSLALPALVLLAADVAVHRTAGVPAPPFGSARTWGIVLLVLSVLLAAALPILIRTLFNARAVKQRSVEPESFARYQRALVAVPLAAAFLADAAYLLSLPRLYVYGSVLAALYGVYSAYPSQKKLAGELRYYGLAGKGSEGRGR